MPRVTIDGAPYEVLPGATILEQIRSCGRDVPTLCDDERLAPFGGCRLCLVEVDGRSRPVTACDTPVVDGMSIRTSTDAVEAQRPRCCACSRATTRATPSSASPRSPFIGCCAPMASRGSRAATPTRRSSTRRIPTFESTCRSASTATAACASARRCRASSCGRRGIAATVPGSGRDGRRRFATATASAAAPVWTPAPAARWKTSHSRARRGRRAGRRRSARTAASAAR